MANTYTNLSSLFTAIADKIRKKTGSTAEIVADDFPDAIDNILTPTDGSIATKTSSNLTVSGATVTVPAGYYASNVTYTIPTETKSVTPSSLPYTVNRTSGKYMTSVTVNKDSNLVASNIKSGVSIFGVTGTCASYNILTPTSIELASNWNYIYINFNSVLGSTLYGSITFYSSNLGYATISFNGYDFSNSKSIINVSGNILIPNVHSNCSLERYNDGYTLLVCIGQYWATSTEGVQYSVGNGTVLSI